MDSKNTFNRYPKNKPENKKKLSQEQLSVRKSGKKKYYYKESYLIKHGRRNGEEKEIRCNKCGISQPIEEFYVRNDTKKRRKSCRDCQMKVRGVVEIGKQRFSAEILSKGFRRCSICKTIKPLTDYNKSKDRYGGHSNNCYECNHRNLKKFQQKGCKEINDWYVREYGKRNGIKKFNKAIIQKLREEIIESRKPKYFIDNYEFVTIRDFAIYIKKKYGHPITMTEKRINKGKTEEQCKLSEREMRILYSGTNKGRIKVTDTVTNKVYFFDNTSDPNISKIINKSSLLGLLKRGGVSRVTSLSKSKNPLKAEREHGLS